MIAKIAAIQMASGSRIKANLMVACRLVRDAARQGADMVVLPECFALMAMNDAETLERAEILGKGQIQDTIRQCAIENEVWIAAGSVPIRSSASSDKVYNTLLVYNHRGERVGRYDKIHLFDVDIEGEEAYRESDVFLPGDRVVVIDTPFGRIGLSICYDLRFPLLYREMVKQGAQIFLIPAAFTHATGEVHWEPLVRARAIENQCYVIASAQGGYHVNGRHTYGHTMVVDYLGKIQGSHIKDNGIVMLEIDLKAQQQLRNSFPVLEHDKLF